MIVSSPTLVVFGSLSESRAAVTAMAVAWRASPSSLVADQILPLEVSLEVSLNILPREWREQRGRVMKFSFVASREKGRGGIGEI